MVSITLAVPEELKKQMDKHLEMNWSEVARQSIREKIELLEKMDRMLAKSTLTMADTIRMGRAANKRLAKRYRSL